MKLFIDTVINLLPDFSLDHFMRIKGFTDHLIELGDIDFRDKEIKGYEYRGIDIAEYEGDSFVFDGERYTEDFSGLSVSQLKECCRKRNNIKGFLKLKRDELKEVLVLWQSAWKEALTVQRAELQQREG